MVSAQDNSSTAQVQTQHGTIVGFTRSSPGGGDFDVFLGVPFAEPPVGPKRFANPEFYGEFPNGKVLALAKTMQKVMNFEALRLVLSPSR